MTWRKQAWEQFKHGVDWYGRHQKTSWAVGVAIILIWAAYDTGSVVANKSMEASVGVSQGVWTLAQLNHEAQTHPGGHLYIDNVTLFRDASGKTWTVENFRDNASRDTLIRLRDEGVTVDGDLKVEIVPHKLASKNVLLSVVLDLAVKASFLVFYGFMGFLLFRQLRTAGGNNGIFGKRFRRLDANAPVVKLDDVAVSEGTKKEITEIVEYLREPDRFKRTGAKPLRGVLLYGPPGNGKTLMAKAIAGEAQANFLEQEASSFVQLFVGAGAMAVRQLFQEARKIKPCVIFIDEFDALGGSRSGVSSSDERAQAVNALLAEMDGFANNDGVVVVAATNRLEELDEALVRPGRFDRKVRIPMPSRPDRLAILKVHARRIPRMTADLERWADQTRGFSGADLANLINEAAMESSRKNIVEVGDHEFAMARDRVLIGVRDHNRKASPRDRRFVAYHELGHAVVRIHTGGIVEKVSIQPRGMALGVTLTQQDDEETLLQTEDEIRQELQVLMGGRAAEEVFCKAITGGAADDMQRASRLAREAIKRYGFDAHGPYVPEHEALMQDIELRAAAWVKQAYTDAKAVMTTYQEAIEGLYERLLIDEEVDGTVIVTAMGHPTPPSATTPLLPL